MQKKIRDNPPPLYNYEKIEGYVFPETNTVGIDVLEFDRIGPRGRSILGELKRVGILEEFYPGQARLLKAMDLNMNNIRTIAGGDLETTLDVLQQGRNGGIALYQGHSTWNNTGYFYETNNNYDNFPSYNLTQDGIAAYLMP